MLRVRNNRWKLRLGVILFLAGQLIAAAHANEFGASPHQHNGYSCLAVLLDDPEGPAPVVELFTPALSASAGTSVQVTRSAPNGPGHALRPPATGPPQSKHS